MPIERPQPPARLDAAERDAWRETALADVAPEREARSSGGGGGSVRYFELYEAHAPGSTTQAYPRPWDNTAGDYVTDTSADTFPVVDVLGEFRGRARGVEYGWDGSKGMAVQRHGQWEIEKLEKHAIRIICTVNEPSISGGEAGFCGTDSWITVDNVVVTQPVDTALLMAEVTQVFNLFDWEGDTGQTLEAEWNDAEERWDAAQKDCGAIGSGC